MGSLTKKKYMDFIRWGIVYKSFIQDHYEFLFAGKSSWIFFYFFYTSWNEIL